MGIKVAALLPIESGLENVACVWTHGLSCISLQNSINLLSDKYN